MQYSIPKFSYVGEQLELLSRKDGDTGVKDGQDVGGNSGGNSGDIPPAAEEEMEEDGSEHQSSSAGWSSPQTGKVMDYLD